MTKSQQWQVRDTRDNRLVGNFDGYADAQHEADQLNHLAYMSRDTRYVAVTADLASTCPICEDGYKAIPNGICAAPGCKFAAVSK